jgi:hypothetical protein
MLTDTGDAIVERGKLILALVTIVVLTWALVARFGWLDGCAIMLAFSAFCRALSARTKGKEHE